MALSFEEKVEFFELRLRGRFDGRVTACRVGVEGVEGGRVLVSGFSQFRQTDAFIRGVAREVFGGENVVFRLRVLGRGVAKFGVVRVAVAGLWSVADGSDPERLGSELLFGAVVRVFFREGDFLFVQGPDGYLGFCLAGDLVGVSVEEYLGWKNGVRGVTLVPLGVGDGLVIPVGARLVYEGGCLLLPGGERLRVGRGDVVVSDPGDGGFVGRLRGRAEVFMDSPYLWGGKSEVGIDCSGFVQSIMLAEGIFLPRDASQQCHVGEFVGYLGGFADLLPGDVMFFMNDSGVVFHVGIWLGNDEFLHSGGGMGPTVSSVVRGGVNFMSRYDGFFCYARRVH